MKLQKISLKKDNELGYKNDSIYIPFKEGFSAKGVTIGDRFIPKDNNKRKDIYTVIDIYTITNSKKEIVGYEFIAEHDYLGQKIISKHPASSIIRTRIS